MSDKQLRLQFIEKNKRYSLYSQLLTIIIVVSGIFVLAFMWKSKLRLQEVVITGTKALTQKEILIQSGLDTTEHSYLHDIELADIRQHITKHPFVRRVKVSHGDKGVISIEIEERVPIASIKSTNGDLQYIDNEGKILPYRLFSVVSDVPIVHGVETIGKVDSVGLQELIVLLKELQICNNGELYQQISEILYDPNNASFQLRSADIGLLITIGNTKNLPNKLFSLYTFLVRELPKLPKDSIDYIDLRWLSQLVIKKKILANNRK